MEPEKWKQILKSVLVLYVGKKKMFQIGFGKCIFQTGFEKRLTNRMAPGKWKQMLKSVLVSIVGKHTLFKLDLKSAFSKLDLKNALQVFPNMFCKMSYK